MTELEKAWLAGFVDGDGCIFVGKALKVTGGKNPCYQLHLSITQTNKSILEYIKRLVGFGTVNLQVKFEDSERKNTSWHIIFKSNDSFILLKQLLPYLKIKKLEAQLAIQFHQNKNKQSYGGIRGSHPLPEEEIKWREMHYQLLRYIKLKRKDIKFV